MSTQIDIEEIENAIEGNLGFCTNCKDFTNDCVESDAEKYICIECKKKTVYGTEMAILMGFLN